MTGRKLYTFSKKLPIAPQEMSMKYKKPKVYIL